MPLSKLHPMQAFGVVRGAARGVRVTRLEERLAPRVPFPHKHDFIHIVVPTKGTGWHEIDFVRHPVAPGSVFVMRPAQVHSWQLAAQTSGYVVELEASAMPRRSTLPAADCIMVEKNAWREIVGLCELMAVENERQASGFEEVLQGLFAAFLPMLRRQVPAASAPVTKSASEGETSALFAALLEAEYRKHHDVDFYARRLKLTPKALTMRVTRATGISARGKIHDRLLLEARRLLAYSDLAIGAISGELGFEDPNYFARFFRKRAGESPGAFRTRARRSS